MAQKFTSWALQCLKRTLQTHRRPQFVSEASSSESFPMNRTKNVESAPFDKRFQFQYRSLCSKESTNCSGGEKNKTSQPKISKAPAPPPKNVTISTLLKKKRQGKQITMVTACDYPAAVHCDVAGIDVVLVGDSLGMVELGMNTTLGVTLDMIIHHSKAVTRGCSRPLVVTDLPFGCYELDPATAAESAIRILKEVEGVDAVKAEGGRNRIQSIRSIIDAGVAVMGHIGLTPQSFSVIGGFKAQGRLATSAYDLIQDGLALQEAGAFAVVCECVPAVVSAELSKALDIPVIGIGSGLADGQVLVYHDMLGMLQHHHHATFTPRFCKQYATVGVQIQRGLEEYKADVEQKRFPCKDFSPYNIPPEEYEKFIQMLSDKDTLPKGTKTKARPESCTEEANIKVY